MATRDDIRTATKSRDVIKSHAEKSAHYPKTVLPKRLGIRYFGFRFVHDV